MKKFMKFIFIDNLELLYMIGIIYAAITKDIKMAACFTVVVVLIWMGTLKTDIKRVLFKMEERPRTVHVIERDGERYYVNRREYNDKMFVEQIIYGVFRFQSDATRYCHLMNTGRWDKYIGSKVYVASNAGCYVGYEEFFDCNDCVEGKHRLSHIDIPTDREYEVLDVGFDSSLNKVLVLGNSVRGSIWLYRYSDLSESTPNIYEVL